MVIKSLLTKLNFIKNLKVGLNRRKAKTKESYDENNNFIKSVEKENYESTFTQQGSVDVIIDGISYCLTKDESGIFHCDRDFRTDLINQILRELRYVTSTGYVVAKIFLASIDDTKVILHFYDHIGNEVSRKAIEQQAKVKATEIGISYLDHMSLEGKIDPRLLKKARESIEKV